MKYRLFGGVAAIVTSLLAVNANAVTIDTYNTSQFLNTSGGASSSSVNDVNNILGIEREVTITPISGTTSSVSVNGTNPGTLEWANGAGSQSTIVITYDGVGSGGFSATDFTDGGTNDRFLFNVEFADFANNITIDVTSDSGATSSLTTSTPSAVFGSPQGFSMLFSNFVGTADFTQITVLEMTLTTVVDAADLRLDFLATADATENPPLDPPPVVSAPKSLAIFGLALIGMAGYRRRLKKVA